MPDFTVRSDSVNVEQIMEQIRSRIREKRGVDYTEQQIRDLAAVKLEKFLDPRAVRSDLLQQFRKMQAAHAAGPDAAPEAGVKPPPSKIRWFLRGVLRRLLRPVARTIVDLNDADARARADMYYELFHNLVVELTRTSIEVKNLKMRVESLTGRLEFNERRARALESVVVYKPSNDESLGEPSSSRLQGGEPGRGSRDSQGLPGSQSSLTPSLQGSSKISEPQPLVNSPSAGAGQPSEGPGQRSRRRRRRRGRRGSGSAAALMGAGSGPLDPATGRPAADSAAARADRTTELESASDRPDAIDAGPNADREHHQSTDSDPSEP